MSSQWEKQTISRLLRDSILHVCKNQQVYGGQFDVDAIVCISGQSEGQEIVVKIHERLGNNAGSLALTDFLARPREGWSSVVSASHQEDNAEDYSLKRRRIDDSVRGSRMDDAMTKSHEADSYPNLKQHLMNPSHHSRDLREVHDLRKNGMQNRDTSSSGVIEVAPLSPGMGQATNFSSEVDMSESQSPPPGSQFPYTSTPLSIFPRRIPLRSDRWSPNQPIPSIPECKPCGYTFESFEGLSDHNEAVHSVFTCQSCFKTFTSRSNLERHSRLHTGHRPYGCTICGKTFSRKDHLSNHATKHAYKCGTCSKRFNDKKLLVTHYSYDHNAVLTNICELCNKGFSSAEQYEDHLKVHPQCMTSRDDDDDVCMPQNLSTAPTSPHQASLVCKTCSFRTADKLTMIKHRIIHQDNARCYTCLSCSKLYDDPLHYSDHLLVHSDETNIFECCICRQICPTLTSLRRHEATHIHLNIDEDVEQSDADRENMDAFRCTMCSKTFQTAQLLEEHLEIHQKSDSGFACTVCQQEYDNYADICSHIEQEGHYVYPNRAEKTSIPRNTEDTPKNKRKQKLPKSVKNMEDMSPESDVEIVEPESPEDTEQQMSNGGPAGYITHTNSGEFLVTDNPAPIIEITPDDGRQSPLSQPIKNLLSQTIHARVRQEPVPEKTQRHANTRQTPSKRNKTKSPEKASTSMNAASPESNNNNNILLSPKLMNVEIPEGPYTCSICSSIHPSFQELEMHCFSEHNRSPCMFCSKTFAQKANRDRHVCLHTGDKPYSCPNCNEKFSRGDKLKIHRMRAHQTAFPTVGKAAKELTVSPVDSPADPGRDPADDSRPNSALDGLYGADWSMRRDVPNDFVAATGEWSVREVDDSGIDNGNDLTADESK